MTPEETEADTRRQDEENKRKALESAWDKIDHKVRFHKMAIGKELAIRFTLLELKMLQQFRRKHG